jgi:catechol 2,3-dioxygenase-like lactoylglutathione lyase family enzyme
MTTGTLRTTGFNHVATLTPDLDRYVDFYERMFGARVVQTMEAREDHPRMVLLDVGGTAHIGAFEVPASQIVGERDRIGRRGAIDHFALSVGSREELEALRDRLVQAGASPGEITDFGTELSVFFRDPDGAELEVCYHPTP